MYLLRLNINFVLLGLLTVSKSCGNGEEMKITISPEQALEIAKVLLLHRNRTASRMQGFKISAVDKTKMANMLYDWIVQHVTPKEDKSSSKFGTKAKNHKKGKKIPIQRQLPPIRIPSAQPAAPQTPPASSAASHSTLHPTLQKEISMKIDFGEHMYENEAPNWDGVKIPNVLEINQNTTNYVTLLDTTALAAEAGPDINPDPITTTQSATRPTTTETTDFTPLPPTLQREVSMKIDFGEHMYDVQPPSWNRLGLQAEKRRDPSVMPDITVAYNIMDRHGVPDVYEDIVTSLNPDIPTFPTWGSRPTTPISPPFLQHIHNELRNNSCYYFSTFVTNFCKISKTKNQHSQDLLVQGANVSLHRAIERGKFKSLGGGTKRALLSYLDKITTHSNVLTGQLNICEAVFKNHSLMRNETAMFLEIIEPVITETEGNNLLRTLVPLHDYPATDMEPYLIMDNMLGAILKIYDRLLPQPPFHTLLFNIETYINSIKTSLRSRFRGKDKGFDKNPFGIGINARFERDPFNKVISFGINSQKTSLRNRFRGKDKGFDIGINARFDRDPFSKVISFGINSQKTSPRSRFRGKDKGFDKNPFDIGINARFERDPFNKVISFGINSQKTSPRSRSRGKDKNFDKNPIDIFNDQILKRPKYLTDDKFAQSHKKTEHAKHMNDLDTEKNEEIRRKFYENFIQRKGEEDKATEKNVFKNIMQESSYSDLEPDLKFNLNDALRHGNFSIESRRTIATKEENNTNDWTSENDEEALFKSKIYKAFSYKHNVNVRH